MTIAEFLEARIAEDEAAAVAASVSMHGTLHDSQSDWACYVMGAERDSTQWQDEHIMTWWPQRVLAECMAKRAIIGRHEAKRDFVYEAGEFALCSMCTETGPNAQGWPCGTIRALAAVYSDHPDYNKDWAL